MICNSIKVKVEIKQVANEVELSNLFFENYVICSHKTKCFDVNNNINSSF